MIKIKSTKYVFLAALCLMGCAAVGPPGGGPVDDIAPFVVSTEPASGEINVATDTEIRIVFSEPMNAATLQEALFISPTPLAKPKVKVDGRIMSIRPLKFAVKEQTTVITIGSGAKDIRQVAMRQSYSFAFSSSAALANRRIKGRLFPADAAVGMLVGAWRIETNEGADSLAAPPFATMTGADGGYDLNYLPTGKYRIFCWDDKDKNRRYSPSIDRLGIPWQDIDLTNDSLGWMAFQPQKRDTSTLKPLLITALDRTHIQMRYNKRLDAQSFFSFDSLSISYAYGSLPILMRWIDVLDSTREILLTEPQEPDTQYILKWSAREDGFDFKGTHLSDTTKLRIIKSYPANGMANIAAEISGWIAFDDALMDSMPIEAFKLIAPDSSLTDILLTLDAPNLIRWNTLKALKAAAKYQMTVDMAILSDRCGNKGDALWSIVFTTLDPTELGSISGRVAGWSVGDNMYIAARLAVGIGKDSDIFSRVAPGGDFVISNLASGSYILWSWKDIDYNNRYDAGRYMPFGFAEPFVVSSDTITVRPRWESGGVMIDFK